MKKWILIFSLVASWGYAQSSTVSYDASQREFNAALEQLLQEFTKAQEALGNEVIVTFYNAEGEAQMSQQSLNAPDFLKMLSDQKMNFMQKNKLLSTKGVYFVQSTDLNP